MAVVVFAGECVEGRAKGVVVVADEEDRGRGRKQSLSTRKMLAGVLAGGAAARQRARPDLCASMGVALCAVLKLQAVCDDARLRARPWWVGAGPLRATQPGQGARVGGPSWAKPRKPPRGGEAVDGRGWPRREWGQAASPRWPMVPLVVGLQGSNRRSLASLVAFAYPPSYSFISPTSPLLFIEPIPPSTTS